MGRLRGSYGAVMGQLSGSYGAVKGQLWGVMGQLRGSYAAVMGRLWGSYGAVNVLYLALYLTRARHPLLQLNNQLFLHNLCG